MRNPGVLVVASGGPALHPKARALITRVRSFRKMWHAFPQFRDDIYLAFDAYASDASAKPWGP
eukprot:11404409-Alexandrium_andersonii.AAC.1